MQKKILFCYNRLLFIIQHIIVTPMQTIKILSWINVSNAFLKPHKEIKGAKEDKQNYLRRIKRITKQS